MKMLGFAWWAIAVCLAYIQGGFWWVFLNVFIPISPALKIAEYLSKL